MKNKPLKIVFFIVGIMLCGVAVYKLDNAFFIPNWGMALILIVIGFEFFRFARGK